MWDDEQERRTFLTKTAAIGGLVLGSSGSAAAASTVHVDKDDPDAYDSIQRAVFDAPSGSTVEIAPGVYTESFAIPKSKSLTIRGDTGDDEPGAGPDAPIIDGEGRVETALFITGPSQNAITVEGLEFRDWGADLASGESADAITSYKRSNVTVRDTTIRNIAGKGIATADSGGQAAQNWFVERCRFDTIARNGVQFGSVDGGAIRNNEFRSTEQVPDRDGTWWERDRPAGNPVYGILVTANAGEGNEGRLKNVTVEGNDLRGQFDAGAIGLFSYNYGGTDVLLENVTVRNNHVELEPLDYDDDEVPSGRGNHGVRIDANSGQENRLAAIRDVEVAGNDISGAGDGVITISWARSQDDGPKGVEGVTVRENAFAGCKEAVRFTTYNDGRTRDITVTGNETTDCNTGTIVYTGSGGRTTNVTVTNNRFVDFDLGVVPWASGRKIDGVDILGNEFVRSSDPADTLIYAIEPVAFGADVKNVRVSDSAISKTRRGIAAFALQASETDVTVEDCQFTENRDGIGTFAFDADSTVELRGERLTFERNEVGVRTGREASGDNLHVHSSDFRKNTEYAAENRSGVGVVDATCNYWGDPTGPTHDSNDNGRGDEVSDGVDYDPLLPQAFEQVSGNACHPAGGNPNEHAGGSSRSENDAKPKGGGSPPEHAAGQQ